MLAFGGGLCSLSSLFSCRDVKSSLVLICWTLVLRWQDNLWYFTHNIPGPGNGKTYQAQRMLFFIGFIRFPKIPQGFVNTQPIVVKLHHYRTQYNCWFLYRGTGPQWLRTLFFCSGSCCYEMFKALKLFHFVTDSNQTLHAGWWQPCPQLHRVAFSS